jgi:hypothetical protein
MFVVLFIIKIFFVLFQVCLIGRRKFSIKKKEFNIPVIDVEVRIDLINLGHWHIIRLLLYFNLFDTDRIDYY